MTITNVSDTKFHIEWSPPEYANDLRKYKIQVKVLSTYTKKNFDIRTWEFSNETLHTEINYLQPGTLYDVIIQGMSSLNDGMPAHNTVEMKIGGNSLYYIYIV